MTVTTDTTIMIIDDEPENLRALEVLLTRQGYAVRSFPGGREALASARAQPPDLMLLDLRMPAEDGVDLCTRMKSSEQLSHIPILMLSAGDDPGEKARAFELGVADCITKPFQSAEVLARVDAHLSLGRYRRELERFTHEKEACKNVRAAEIIEINQTLEKEAAARKAAQETLEISEQRYRSIVTTSNEAIFTTDKSFTIIFANQVALELFQGAEDQIIGHSVLSFVHEEDREQIQRRFRHLRIGESEKCECRIRRLGGEARWVIASASAMMGDNGRFAGSVAMLTDITERKQAEEALRQSSEFNQAVLKSLLVEIAVLDRNGEILAVNESWMRFARENDAPDMDRIGPGANYLEVCKKSSSAGSQEAQAALAGISSVLTGRRDRFEFEYACNTPSEQRWCLMIVTPFKGRKGGVIVTHRNITKRKASEIELKEALEQISRLKNQIEADYVYLQEEIKLEHDYEQIIGNSDEIKYTLYRLEQVAKTDSTVIILGETGTGKELIARALHSTGSRADRPLIKVNCATLPAQFIESELFGHVKGAFTDAVADRQGRFALADKGTLFLDEIGELPLDLQPKLLRVLQDGEFERLGDSRTIKTDVRVIAATNRNLEEQVQAGKFRKDLWYRLNVFPITIPPLRKRKADIPALVNHFTRIIAKRTGKNITQVPERVLNEFAAYDWPGNVRELEHVIERAIITSPGNRLQLMESLAPAAVEESGRDMKSHADMEREHLVRVLEQTRWVIDGPNGAARILKIHPNTLRYRMKKLDLRRPA